MKRFIDFLKKVSDFEISARKWCLWVVLTFIGFVGTAVTLVFVVDPYYRYRLPFFYDTVYNEIYATGPKLLKELDYDTFFLGSSMTRNFFLNDIDETLNVKSVKFSASGATTADLVKFFNIAKDAKGNKLKKVFLSLDVYSMNKDPETAHYKDFEYLYRSDLKEEYRYYFSRQTYSAMLYLIKRKFRPSKKRQHQTDPNRMFSTEYAGMKFGKAVVLEDAVKNVRIHHTMAPENPAVFAKNLREQLLPIIADNQNIQFVVYLAPYHIYTYCQSEQFKEADALIRQRTVVMNELLKYPNVTLFDFQADRSFVCNDEYFSDVQHFSSAAARVLLKKLASGERKITSIAEINANEAELRALIAEQMPSYYADIKNYKEPKR